MSEKLKFTIRLVSWLLVALAAPIIFMIVRFEMFQTVTKVSIGGWGLVLIIFVAVFLLYILKTIEDGFMDGIVKQTFKGIRKITVPLVIVIIALNWLDNCLDELLEFLIFITICETVAIPINPLPEWMRKNNIEFTAFNIKEIINILKNKKS